MKLSKRLRSGWVVLGLAVAALMLVPAISFAQDVPTLSAGIGKGDRAPHKDYSLKLVFAERNGPYVANVNVTIKDASGNKVVDTVSKGPWLFAKLPEGDYHVVAKLENGTATGARFKVGMDGQTVVNLAFAPQNG